MTNVETRSIETTESTEVEKFRLTVDIQRSIGESASLLDLDQLKRIKDVIVEERAKKGL